MSGLRVLELFQNGLLVLLGERLPLRINHPPRDEPRKSCKTDVKVWAEIWAEAKPLRLPVRPVFPGLSPSAMFGISAQDRVLLIMSYTLCRQRLYLQRLYMKDVVGCISLFKLRDRLSQGSAIVSCLLLRPSRYPPRGRPGLQASWEIIQALSWTRTSITCFLKWLL